MSEKRHVGGVTSLSRPNRRHPCRRVVGSGHRGPPASTPQRLTARKSYHLYAVPQTSTRFYRGIGMGENGLPREKEERPPPSKKRTNHPALLSQCVRVDPHLPSLLQQSPWETSQESLLTPPHVPSVVLPLVQKGIDPGHLLQYPDWQTLLAQNASPLPQVPLAWQQSPCLPVHNRLPWSMPHLPVVL
jgi:hypothetical protein